MKKIVPKNAILIPDTAKKVFTGQIFDVYQWPQEMFDGTTKDFELLKRPDTTQVIAIKDGQLVLVEDEQPGRSPRVHFPGGRADEDDDSWLTAAQREMKEETGMTFKTWKLIDVQQPIPKGEWFVPWYLATDLDTEGQQQLDADGEKITVLQKDFETLRRDVLSGKESTMQYAIPLFVKCQTLEDLLNLPEFEGQEVDR